MNRRSIFGFGGLLAALGVARAQNNTANDWYWDPSKSRMSLVCNGKTLRLPNKAPYNLPPEVIAHRIALALAADPHVVLEIRPQGDGTFRVVLAPEVVEQVVLKVLEEK